MSKGSISFGRPMIGDSERQAVADVLAGTTLVHGSVTHEFEACFAERVGAKHAVSLSSCTAGLHLSLFVQGVGPGDEVLVPAMTHVATAHAVEFCGAKPVFVDVSPESGNVDPAALEAALCRRTRAAMLVHYLGLPCDMDHISDACGRNNVFIVEDCALAIDATYDDVKVGTLGLTGSFSFYPTKHMTTIEGGMLTTNDDNVAAAISQCRAFGYDRSLSERTKPGVYDVKALGYNYRMNEVEAAVGLAQLKKLDGFQQARTENYRSLKVALTEMDEVTVFEDVQGKSVSSHYCLNVVLPMNGSVDRDLVIKALNVGGIGSSVHYPSAVPLFAYYREKYGYVEGQFPIAEWLAEQTISLPVGPHLRDGDSQRIAEVFKEAVRQSRN